MNGFTPKTAYAAFVAGKLTYIEYHRIMLQWNVWQKGAK